jgi:hypothetical protein
LDVLQSRLTHLRSVRTQGCPPCVARRPPPGLLSQRRPRPEGSGGRSSRGTPSAAASSPASRITRAPIRAVCGSLRNL